MQRGIVRSARRCGRRYSPHLDRTMTQGCSVHRESVPAVVLCVDFDETITKHDTIKLLFDAAIEHRVVAEQQCHKEIIAHLVHQYAAEIEVFKQEALPVGGASCKQAFDGAGLARFLAEYSKIDLKSIDRVIASGALRGIPRQRLALLGSQIEIREHASDVLAAAKKAYVVSSNWSELMLKHAISAHAILSSTDSRDIEIISNDLEMDQNELTTGEIKFQVRTPIDKAAWVQMLKRSPGEMMAFIGDSTNDLLALLEADVGILLTHSSSCTMSLISKRFGIRFEPISTHASMRACERIAMNARARGHRVLFTATSWTDIRKVMSHA